MPTATGQGSMRSGVEKKMLYAATATPAAITSCHKGTALPAGSVGKRNTEHRQPEQQPHRDRDNDQPCIDQACAPQMNAAGNEVESAIEKVRSGDQDHARTDRDKAQR